MTRDRRFKALIRRRMRATGENYTAARLALESESSPLRTVVPDGPSPDTRKGNAAVSSTRDNAVVQTPPTGAVPVLSVGDLDQAVAFYDRLGFKVASRHPDYLILERFGAELHLSHWPGHDPKATDGMAYLRVTEVQHLYESLRDSLAADGLLVLNPPGPLTPEVQAELDRRDAADRPHNRLHEIHDTPYGLREFSVIDPAGNLLRIGEPVAVDSEE